MSLAHSFGGSEADLGGGFCSKINLTGPLRPHTFSSHESAECHRVYIGIMVKWYILGLMENDTEKNMENEMETRVNPKPQTLNPKPCYFTWEFRHVLYPTHGDGTNRQLLAQALCNKR